MDADLEVAEVYSTTLVAQLAARSLEAAGIQAIVSADDAGGAFPQLQVRGVRVLVPREDLEDAKAVLAELERLRPAEIIYPVQFLYTYYPKCQTKTN